MRAKRSAMSLEGRVKRTVYRGSRGGKKSFNNCERTRDQIRAAAAKWAPKMNAAGGRSLASGAAAGPDSAEGSTSTSGPDGHASKMLGEAYRKFCGANWGMRRRSDKSHDARPPKYDSKAPHGSGSSSSFGRSTMRAAGALVIGTRRAAGAATNVPWRERSEVTAPWHEGSDASMQDRGDFQTNSSSLFTYRSHA